MEIWLIVAAVVALILVLTLFRRKAQKNSYSTATPGSVADDTMAGMHLFPVSEFNPVPGNLNDLGSGNVTLNDSSSGYCATDFSGQAAPDCSAPAMDTSSSAN